MTGRTLMAVHAHPDDEVISTGGTLARYADEDVRTVVVTCTDGSQGFGPSSALPGDPGHDRDAVAATRRQELGRSCALLGVGRLEMLGYRDSGMAGWAANSRPDAFCNVAVDEPAAALAELIVHYQPQVVVTYDENGGYGHPDHIQTHRVTVAALDRTDTAAKVYFTARSRRHAERMAEVRERLQLSGRPGQPPRATPVGVADSLITTVVDTRVALDKKRAALMAHTSQLSDTVWVRASPEEFAELFGHESFIRVRDRSGAPLPEADLFSGL